MKDHLTLINIQTDQVTPTGGDCDYYEHKIDIKNSTTSRKANGEDENTLSSSSSSSFNASNTSSSFSTSCEQIKNEKTIRNLVLLNEYIDETSTIDIFENKKTSTNNVLIEKLVEQSDDTRHNGMI
jgi:hypothetical protein